MLRPALVIFAALASSSARAESAASAWVDTATAALRDAGLPAGVVPGPEAATPAQRLGAWRALLRDLDDARSPPVWSSTIASADARFAGADPSTLVLFDAGRFLFLDPASGAHLGTADLGTAEPRIWTAGEARVAVTDGGLVGLDPDGQTRWTLAAPGVFPELAVRRAVACAASPDRVECVDAMTGRSLWSRALAEPAVGGPIVAGHRLVLPSASHLDVLAFDDGRRLHRARVGGEISAPLLGARGGDVWVFVGADALLRFDPDRGVVVRRFDGLPPLAAPPVAGPGGLYLEVQPRRGRAIWRASPQRLGPWAPDATGPVLALPDYLGVAVVRGERLIGLDPSGAARFRAPLEAPPTLAVAGSDWLVLGAARHVTVVDGRSGRRASTVAPRASARARLLDLAWTSRGGAVLVADGPDRDRAQLLGLPRPDDPRLDALRVAAVRGVIEASFEAGMRSRACAELARRDSSAPWAWVARLQCPDQAPAAARVILERAPPGSPARAKAAAVLQPDPE